MDRRTIYSRALDKELRAQSELRRPASTGWRGARSAAEISLDRRGCAPDGRLGGDRLGDCRYPLGAAACRSFGVAGSSAPAEAAVFPREGGGTPSPFPQNNRSAVFQSAQ
jgi:hypothetical protein